MEPQERKKGKKKMQICKNTCAQTDTEQDSYSDRKRERSSKTHTHTHTHTYTVCVSLSLTRTPQITATETETETATHALTHTNTHHAHTPDAATMSGLPEGITEAPRLRIQAFSGSRVEYGLSRNVGSISRFFTRYCGLNPRAMPTRCEGLAIEGGRGALTSVDVSV